jgi:hypothetical protein
VSAIARAAAAICSRLNLARRVPGSGRAQMGRAAGDVDTRLA